MVFSPSVFAADGLICWHADGNDVSFGGFLVARPNIAADNGFARGKFFDASAQNRRLIKRCGPQKAHAQIACHVADMRRRSVFTPFVAIGGRDSRPDRMTVAE